MNAPQTLVDVIRARACSQPDTEILPGSRTCRTWADLAARTRRVAQVLRRLGVGRGDRVGILAPNCPEWLEVLFGVHRAGGVVVPVNERLIPSERQWLLDDAAAAVLVGTPDLLDGTGFRGPTWPLGPTYEADLASASDGGDEVDMRPDDLAVIAYTSGTTGVPKGVMWSHRSLFWSAQHNPFPAAVAGGGRILLCAPLHAGGAIVMACNGLAIGARLTIARFAPAAILRILAEENIEFTGLVPTMIAMLVDAAPPGWRAPALRRIYYGAGTLSADLFNRAERVFRCEFQQGYGMTETCIAGTRLDPGDHVPGSDRLASAGKPMPGVDIKVVGEDGTEAAPGTAGEIWIRSPANALGYWQRPDQDRLAFCDTWYRTRDIGRFDRDGYLYLLDRQDDMVKSGGLNVSPAEVERRLIAHPNVEEAAVIGLPDARWGERVTAIVRKRDGSALTKRALTAFCREQLAAFKITRTIIFTDVPLPRTGLGKVSRRAVREQYGGRRTA